MATEEEQEQGLDPQILNALSKIIENICDNRCRKVFSKEPEISLRHIIEYNSRMRVSAQEKFNGPCFIASINFYLTAEDIENNETCGVLLIYIKDEEAGDFLRSLGKSGEDSDDSEVICQNLKTFISEVANEFKSRLGSFGYPGLLLGEPETFVNLVPSGVNFNYAQQTYHDFGFYFKKEKVVAADLALLSADQI